MKLNVLTYNIAGGRDYNNAPEKAVFHPDACLAVIRELDPDIVGLNEVDYNLPRSEKMKLAKYLGDALGYYSYFAPAVCWAPGLYGNAFLSRYPILSAETILVPDPGDRSEPVYFETRCVLHAVVDAPETPIDVFVTHFGLAKLEQANSVVTLFNLARNAKYPVVLMGDFNVLPDNPLLDPIRTILRCTDDLLPAGTHSFPSHDGVMAKHRDGTFEPYQKQLIDYIFVSDDWKIGTPEVVDRHASDHKPYRVTLER